MDDWFPNEGPQTKALQSTAFETLYGGARGGGKTDAGLVWMLKCIGNPNFRGLVIRRNSDDLSDWIDRAAKLYRGYGADIAYKPAVIRFPSGAIIRTGHLKDDQAYTKYQGHEYHRILIEELTQIPDEKRYLQLIASCRSTVPGLDPRIFATTNPGGVGHGWVKRRFVDMAAPNTKFVDPSTNRTRIFIPAKVEDTPQLVKNDPGYVQFLEGLKDTDVELWKAWRLGDWDTFAGQYFKEFRRDLHVIPAFTPNLENLKEWRPVIVSGMDWGRSAPFACLITLVIEQKYEGKLFFRAITFQEVYGTEKMPEEWASIIKRKMINPDVDLSIADVKWFRGDPAMFKETEDGGIGIADQFKIAGIRVQPADNDRLGGWELVHKWLSIAPDGLPYWLITDNCINLIRTLPELVHDESKVEDVDTTGEDHAPDAIRYMFKHLKFIDAKVGGTAKDAPVGSVKIRNRRPLMNLDLDAFTKTTKESRDWRSI